MSKYVWQHNLKGEADRLRLMSGLLDPSSESHLLRIGITNGWRCLEIGAGNGSLSQWLTQRVGPAGHVIASDIHTDLMRGISGGNLEVRKFDVVHDEPPDAPFDLVTIRALLHRLPERRTVVSKMARWLARAAIFLYRNLTFIQLGPSSHSRKNIFGSNSFNGRRAIKSTITSGARFPRGYSRKACSTSDPKDMPFFITAARSLRNGGITASAKSRTSCKAKAACHDQHSTSYLHTIATRH